jgi:hypothetical protein
VWSGLGPASVPSHPLPLCRLWATPAPTRTWRLTRAWGVRDRARGPIALPLPLLLPLFMALCPSKWALCLLPQQHCPGQPLYPST